MAMASPRAKVPPYLLLLVVSFLLVALVGYQTLRGRKLSADLLKEKEFTIHRLDEKLQRETLKASELQEKLTKIASQKEKLDVLKEGLTGQLIELERVKSSTEDDRRKLQSSLQDKENDISDLKDKLSLFQEREEELKLMKDEMSEKDSEISELLSQLNEVPSALRSHSKVNKVMNENATDDEAAKAEHNDKDDSKQDPISVEEGYSKERKRIDDEEELKEEDTSNANEANQEKEKKSETGEESGFDKEEASSNEDTGEEGETQKAHEEDETDEHPDVDMDVVNKADPEENEMAAME